VNTYLTGTYSVSQEDYSAPGFKIFIDFSLNSVKGGILLSVFLQAKKKAGETYIGGWLPIPTYTFKRVSK
jgi:hypothetical protein